MAQRRPAPDDLSTAITKVADAVAGTGLALAVGIGFVKLAEWLLDPNAAEAKRHFERAIRHDQAGDLGLTVHELYSCLRRDWRHAEAHHRLASILCRERQDLDRAVSHAQEACRLRPGEASYALTCALALMFRRAPGDLEHARRACGTATANVPPNCVALRFRISLCLGWIFVHANKPKDALRAFRGAAKLGQPPSDHELVELLIGQIRAYSALGKDSEVRQVRRHLSEIAPDHPELQEAIPPMHPGSPSEVRESRPQLRGATAFISYSQDSPEHNASVLALAQRLRCDGIEVVLDQFVESPPEGWPQWMIKQITGSPFVLLVCTATYRRRFEQGERRGTGLGATWEGNIVTQHLYEAQGRNEKFIPLVLRRDDAENIPIALRGVTRYVATEEGDYSRLYRRLTGQPTVVPAPIGTVRQLPPMAGRWTGTALPDQQRGTEVELRAMPAGGEGGAGFHAEIDAAAALIAEGKPDICETLLSRLWQRSQDHLTAREKFRVLANLGQAAEFRGDLSTAAKRYLEAKPYQPEDERALCLEVIAHEYLGDSATSHRLADQVRARFPESVLAAAAWVASAPPDTPLSDIETRLPPRVRQDPQAALVIARHLFVQGALEPAEGYARHAVVGATGFPEAKVVLARCLAAKATKAVTGPAQYAIPLEVRDLGRQAVALVSEALAGTPRSSSPSRFADLHRLRAFANELAGDLDNARHDAQTAMNYDPEDSDTAIIHARFLSQGGQHDRAVQIMDGVVARSPDLQGRFLLAMTLWARRGPHDLDNAILMLQQAVAGGVGADARLFGDAVAFLTDLLCDAGRADEALTTLGGIGEGAALKPLLDVLHSKALLNVGESPRASEAVAQVITSGAATKDWNVARRLALVLEDLGRFAEALAVWRPWLKPAFVSPETVRMLNCAGQAGDDRFIMEFCSQLRVNGIVEAESVNLELNTLGRYDPGKALEAAEDALQRTHDDSAVRHLRLARAHFGARLGRHDLLEPDPAKLPDVRTVEPEMGLMTVQVLRAAGNPAGAAAYAYELVRQHFADSNAHMAMVAALGPFEGPTPDVPTPKTIAPGTAAHIEEDGVSGRWYIIEDAEEPRAERDEIPPSHPLAQALTGKRVGEHFAWNTGGLRERRGTVREIVHKWVFRYRDCLDRAQDRFPDAAFAERFTLPSPTPTLEQFREMLEPIRLQLKGRAEVYDNLLTAYRGMEISVHQFAVYLGVSAFEVAIDLAHRPDVWLNCCAGVGEEFEASRAAFRQAREVVVDGTALATLAVLERPELLRAAGKPLLVSQSTMQDIHRLAEQADRAGGGMSLVLQGDQVVPVKESSEQAQTRRKALAALLREISESCSVVGGLALADLPPAEREEMIAAVGQACAETIALARESGRVLWSDDLIQAVVSYNRFQIGRIWTQNLLLEVADAGRADRGVVVDCGVRLGALGYSFTLLSPEAVLRAAVLSEWNLDRQPLCGILRQFSNPFRHPQGVFMLACHSLVRLWKQRALVEQTDRVTFRLLDMVAKHPDGARLVRAVRDQAPRQFGLDVVAADRARKSIEAWMAAAPNGGIVLS